VVKQSWMVVVIAVVFQATNASAQTSTAGQTGAPDASQSAPVTITLQDALQRAKLINPDSLRAARDAAIAREDFAQARAALLPGISDTNQYTFSQSNGAGFVRFIANNAVHEYFSQGNAHEVLGPAQIAEYRRSNAAAAIARAKLEIAMRGLVVTVVKSFYGFLASQRKYATAQTAVEGARQFLKISQDLERGGEVAHSDVVKAQIQLNDRSRDLREAELAMERDRIDLTILIFPNFNQNFTVVDDRLPPPLPSLDEVQAQAKHNNPDLAAAAAALQESHRGITVARAAYLPSLTLDYFYGIDAEHFAVRTGRLRNLGYSAMATLTIPVWNWGATHSKVKQAFLREQQAQTELSAAQRRLLGNLRTFYSEAEASRAELDLLRNSADLAAESLRLTTLRYQAGEATVLEVADAQNTVALARNGYEDGEVRYRVALASLQTLTGTI
jgi:outer membrane protein TolC